MDTDHLRRREQGEGQGAGRESGIHALAEEAVEVGFEDVEAGIDHRAVAVAIQFIEEGRGAGRVFRSSRWT